MQDAPRMRPIKAVQDIQRAIARAVIADDQRPILMRLRNQAVQLRRQKPRAVTGGHQDGDMRIRHFVGTFIEPRKKFPVIKLRSNPLRIGKSGRVTLNLGVELRGR